MQTGLDLITHLVEILKCKLNGSWFTGRALQHAHLLDPYKWKMSGLGVSRAAGTSVSKGQRNKGSHIDVACRSVCDRDQNEIKQSTFILGADQGIKTNSE